MKSWWLVPGFGLLIIVVGVAYARMHSGSLSAEQAAQQAKVGCSQVAEAFRRRQSGAWLVVGARVLRILPDEFGTYQHQRFIARCPSGQTLLVTNDVDFGTRVPVSVGARVAVRGQYIWNAQGGLLHYTHHGGPGESGWILFQGRLYSIEAGFTGSA